jgi:hypothetical protein
MRCTQPTIDVTDRQATCQAVSKTFTVGFGKRNFGPNGGDGRRDLATHRDPGYARS